MLDMDKARGRRSRNSGWRRRPAPRSGEFVAGLMVHYLPAPTHFVYFVLAAIFVAQVVGVLFIPELIPPRGGRDGVASGQALACQPLRVSRC